MTILNKLKALRFLSGMNSVALAKKTGISQPHISLLDNGKMPNPSLETLTRLLEPLRGNLDIVVDKDEHPEILTTGGESLTLSAYLEREWDKLSEKQKYFYRGHYTEYNRIEIPKFKEQHKWDVMCCIAHDSLDRIHPHNFIEYRLEKPIAK